MKEIKAFIHRNRIADVLHVLKNNNFCGVRCNLSIIDVAGTLQALDSKEKNYSIEFGEGVIAEVKLELICENERASKAVELIKENARTGQALAGWIYISNIDEAIPIED